MFITKIFNINAHLNSFFLSKIGKASNNIATAFLYSQLWKSIIPKFVLMTANFSRSISSIL